MGLKEYRRKRSFDKTAEPAGRKPRLRSRQLSFVVQKHAASHLHYDFRLELDGVLVSWAVPKGPSLDPNQKRLAVHVEDHPLEYAKFEGMIPAGEYGGGEVIVWDRGKWIPEYDPHAGLAKGHLEFELQGEKLTGRWHLIQIKGREGGKNWLLKKGHDDAAIKAGGKELVDTRPESVISGRTLEDIAAGVPKKSATATKPPARAKRKKTAKKTSARKVSKSGKKLQPFEPQLARLVAEVPRGNEWIHEIKYDGYRLLCTLQNGKATLWTRNQLDWTHRFAAVAHAAEELPAESAILDGEIVALNEKGISSFQALQNSLKGIESWPLVYYVFDLLYLDGEGLEELPLVKRKARLKKLLSCSNTERIRFSDHLSGDGEMFLKHSCRAGLEGIIAKRGDRPYVHGRSDDWVKVKCLQQEELVIGGYTISEADKRDFGALLVGYFSRRKFQYAGRVGTGFNAKLLASLRKDLDAITTSQCPFEIVPARERGDEVRWVEPKLVAQLQFTGWTDDRVLRHPVFLGLREDKTARSVGEPESLHPLEMPEMTKAKAKPKKKVLKEAASEQNKVDYPLTNPDRVLYPELQITKLELATYYQNIAESMLPYLKDRPLSLLRCPEGQAKTCFFQKHAAAGTPDVLDRVEIEEKEGLETYLIANDLPGLLSLAQMGVLEIHLWGSRRDRIEQPDWLVFDLDPEPDVKWANVVDAAHQLRELLKNLSLETFVKVTGGKGVHVVAPLAPRRADWEAVKSFAQRVAQGLAEQYPDRFIAKMSKAARKGKIFIDYLRNERGSTAIAPYSTRAKGRATVSIPLTWDELSAKMKPDAWNVENVPGRLAKLKRDPWEGFWEVKQGLPKLGR